MKRLMLVMAMMGLFGLVSCLTHKPFDVNANIEYVELKNKYLKGLENLLSLESPDTYLDGVEDIREIIPKDCIYFHNYGLSGCPYYQDWADTIKGYKQRIDEYNARVSEVLNKRPKDDVTFLMESSANVIDFNKRSDEQLMEFIFKAHIVLSSVKGARTDRRTYDILKNLLSHYDKAGKILFDKGVCSKDQYNDLRIASMQHDTNLKEALTGL